MKRAKPTLLTIGTVSHATMHSKDLLPAFLDEAERLKLSKAERNTVRAIRAASNRAFEDDDSPYWTEGTAEDDVQSLFDVLDAHCPPYCYFGAIEGDGSDYGCWPSESILRFDDGVCDDVWNDPGDGGRMPKGFAYRRVVSDHGNVTLYDRRGKKVWGVV